MQELRKLKHEKPSKIPKTNALTEFRVPHIHHSLAVYGLRFCEAGLRGNELRKWKERTNVASSVGGAPSLFPWNSTVEVKMCSESIKQLVVFCASRRRTNNHRYSYFVVYKSIICEVRVFCLFFFFF